MVSVGNLDSSQKKTEKAKKGQYKAPAIIYEGKITIRAGSPILAPPGGFNDENPFQFSGD